MALMRHIPFLKAVFQYSFTAFGGPHGHLGMMMKTFVEKRKDITEKELIEFNAFCQMIPGPASTQTVMLIAWKRGGILLSLLTLLIWILPAAVIMFLLSLLVIKYGESITKGGWFHFIQPMAIGFVFYAAYKLLATVEQNVVTRLIMIVSGIAIVVIREPLVFPAILIIAGIVTNFSKKRIERKYEKPKPIKWFNLWLFVAIFVVAGVVSEIARINQWEWGRLANLFENFYRFGSIIFGGGQALIPMMLVQFIVLPQKRGLAPYMSSGELLTGFGMVQAVPGPVFSVCTYLGAIAMSSYGFVAQLLGGIVGLVAVYLPSTLMLFFLYPIYQNLKQHVIIFRALEGINAAIIGIIAGSGIVMFLEINKPEFNLFYIIEQAIIVLGVFLTLKLTKIPAPIIVLLCLLGGVVYSLL